MMAHPGILRHRDPDISRRRRGGKPGGDGPTVRGGFQDFCGYFDALCEDRRANPRDDLATIVATAKDPNGEYLPKSYSYGYYMAIATAGTTPPRQRWQAASAAVRHPDVWPGSKRIEVDPNLIMEALRIVAPVKHSPPREQTTRCAGRPSRRATG